MNGLIINEQIVTFLEDHILRTDAQDGFHHVQSTGDVLSLTTEHFNQVQDQCGEARLLALGISKAFGTGSHSQAPLHGIPEHVNAIISELSQID